MVTVLNWVGWFLLFTVGLLSWGMAFWLISTEILNLKSKREKRRQEMIDKNKLVKFLGKLLENHISDRAEPDDFAPVNTYLVDGSINVEAMATELAAEIDKGNLNAA